MSNFLNLSDSHRPEHTGTDPAIESREDPLLDFGSFIDPDVISDGPEAVVDHAPDGDQQGQETSTNRESNIDPKSPEPRTPLHGAPVTGDQDLDRNQKTSEPLHPPQSTSNTAAMTDSVNVEKRRNPAPAKPTATVAGTPDSGARRVKPGADPASWLPQGWRVEDRMRNSGATAGTVDKYYFDPVSGFKFRSKKEVFEFLETGTTRKKRKAMENPDADMNTSGGSGKRKSKKSDSKALNFDYSNVPEKVEWVLTDSLQDSWSPCIGDVKVSEPSKRDWMAAFTFQSTKSGRTKI
ncbi:Methyl-CpG-binding domain-containing protein 6 [Tripterygium wilfordii]|uniref:Methyl-CpG-binding domain-containing protein 6 n=1 Tax=Tripterygium wilfordii TaxID=458696 RepID=A0A7J7DYQ7_TRIWF|nr:methyl-CpG-binding domain-containing protein 5-like [Tripterygium wilfordii]KAF5751443.1 Methyl-CpG-binding domain-containing protein 6 [Tripterygium wilfordii]